MKWLITIACIISYCYFLHSPIFAQSPSFGWAKQTQGPSQEFCFSITTDESGNVYACGHFYGTEDFDPGASTYYLSSAGLRDMFMMKLDAAGNFVWAKRIGGTGNEDGRSITVDDAGDVIVTGDFNGTVDFDPGAGVYNLSTVGNDAVYVAKFDSSGNFMWADQMGWSGFISTYSIAVDTSGNIYATGNFMDSIDFDPGPGIYNLTSFDAGDAFVFKLDPLGNFIWVRQIGGTNNSHSNSVFVDAAGNVYFAGDFEAICDFDPGPGVYNLTSAGSSDLFVAKLDSSGNFLWAGQIGDGGFESCFSISVTKSGCLYFTTGFDGTLDVDPGPGIFNLTSFGSYDAVVVKLDTSGNLVWAKQSGGPGNAGGSFLSLDEDENIYFTGNFTGTVDFDPGPGIFNFTDLGQGDVFITKIDTSGNFIWAIQFEGPSWDDVRGLSVDRWGNVFTAGTLYGTVDFDPGPDTFFLISTGNYDTFIQKTMQCETMGTITLATCNSYTSPSNNYIWTTSGTYLDTIPNALGCDSIITINLTVNTIDTSINQSGPTLTANATGIIYQWIYCDSVPIASETNQSFSPQATGNYAVILIENGCTDTSGCYFILVNEIENEVHENGILVYPNPTSGLIHLPIKELADNLSVSVFNSTGQKILSQSYYSEKEIEFEFQGVSGIYLLEVKINNENEYRLKILKE